MQADGTRKRVASRCHSRRCVSCGVLWAGDTRRKLLENVSAYRGSVVLVTITGPGADRLPWDFDAQTGERLDTADPIYATAWNLSAPERWRSLHRAARQRAKRKHGTCTVLGRTWEYQRRGVLHVHVVLGVETAREMAAAHTYADALSELRGRHDFGWVDRGRRTGRRRCLEVIPAARAARYLAKYLTPLGDDGKVAITATVTRRDVPGHVVYLNRELTQGTGITMRNLRMARWVHYLLRDLGFDGEQALRLVIDEGCTAQKLLRPRAGP